MKRKQQRGVSILECVILLTLVAVVCVFATLHTEYSNTISHVQLNNGEHVVEVRNLSEFLKGSPDVTIIEIAPRASGIVILRCRKESP